MLSLAALFLLLLQWLSGTRCAMTSSSPFVGPAAAFASDLGLDSGLCGGDPDRDPARDRHVAKIEKEELRGTPLRLEPRP